ncbi:MAG: FHA domain-containing protein [Planctomycetota bacterium]|nr:FHA domain-containing protein [Planctomycetota bacterium]
MQTVKLYIVEGGAARVFEITPNTQIVTMGRSPENTIQLLETRSSRLHCQIERIPEGFKLVDLESTNGTSVNGAKVNTYILSQGDIIEVGAVSIRFGESVPSPVHGTPGAPVHAQIPPVPVFTHAPAGAAGAEPPPPIIPSAPLPMHAPDDTLAAWRKQQLVRRIISIAAALIIVIIVLAVGKGYYNEYMAEKRARELYENATTAMEDGNNQECLTLCEELTTKYPNSTQAAQAKVYLDKIKKQVEYEKIASNKLSVVDKMAGDLEDQPARLANEYAALAEQYPNTPAAEKASARAKDLRAAVAKAAEARLDECVKTVTDALAKGDFAEASRVLGKFAIEFEGMPVVAKAEEHRRAVTEAASAAFDKIATEVKDLLVKEHYDSARQIYQDALAKFEGTVFYFKIQSKLRGIDALAAGGQENVLSAKVRATREDCLQLALKADELARNQRYTQAYDMYRNIINERLSAPELAEIRKEFELRSQDIKAQAELFEILVTCVNSGKLSTRDYELGGGIMGTVKKATPESLEISFNNESGMVKLHWFNIPAKTFYDLYKRCKFTNEQSFVLGVYCFNNKLTTEGSATFQDVVKADAAKKTDVDAFIGRWRGIPVPKDGFIFFENAWYTPVEHQYALLRRRVDKIVARLKENDEKVVETALLDYKAIVAQPDLTTEFKDTSRERVAAGLAERRTFLFNALKHVPSMIAVDQRKALKEELNLRRKQALAIIMDEPRYPYPYKQDPFDKGHVADFKKWLGEQKFDPETLKELENYIIKSEGMEYAQVVQMFVDKLVARVRELWNKPGEGIKLDKNVQELVAKIKLIDEKYLPDIGAEAQSDEEIVGLMAMINQSIDLKNICLNGTETGILEYNKKVWEFNEKTNVSLVTVEKEQIKITNKYREMFGRRIVAINEKLGRATRKHSEWMLSVGRLSHEQDNPKTKSPSDRVGLEGYGGGASENICVGHEDPEGAHEGWCHSSGHHRNILMDGHTEMGVGKAGAYWTQNFGAGGVNFEKPDQLETEKKDAGKKGPGK